MRDRDEAAEDVSIDKERQVREAKEMFPKKTLVAVVLGAVVAVKRKPSEPHVDPPNSGDLRSV